jgi:hypothetical protein
MERAVEIFATVHFLIMGLSHVIHSRAWAEFFMWLHERGRAGVFVHGFISLGFGSVIVAFHNVWSGLPMVLTIVGWLYILKALLCFLVPQTQVRTLGRVSPERAREFVIPGILFIAMAVLLLYILWRQ